MIDRDYQPDNGPNNTANQQRHILGHCHSERHRRISNPFKGCNRCGHRNDANRKHDEGNQSCNENPHFVYFLMNEEGQYQPGFETVPEKVPGGTDQIEEG